MTNTGFVALPILHAIYGQPAVLPAAVATIFVAAVMFPATVILLETEQLGPHARSARAAVLAKQIVLNPMVISILLGLAWTIAGVPLPASIVAYLNIFAGALTPCALFAIGSASPPPSGNPWRIAAPAPGPPPPAARLEGYFWESAACASTHMLGGAVVRSSLA